MKKSSDCQHGGHSLCSGKVWSRLDKHGKALYERCDCFCRKTASAPAPLHKRSA